MLKCLSGIVTLTFNNGTSDCGDWLVPPSSPGRADLSGVFATTCVLYSNDLPSETVSSTSWISSLWKFHKLTDVIM